MGLARRIIPTLLARGDELVKGERFNAWRSVGHVLQAARIHAARGVDELIVLDIAATPNGRGPDFDLVRKIAEAQYTPLTAGGGVRSVDDVRELLRAGADKVAIKTHIEVIASASMRFGRQAIVAVLDVPGGVGCERVRWARDCARKLEDEGAGEILLTAMDREGMLQGYDLELVREVAAAVDLPVIAHGGCGTYEHMLEAIEAGAHAVAAGAMFQFTDNTPRGAARYLAKKGLEVRL